MSLNSYSSVERDPLNGDILFEDLSLMVGKKVTLRLNNGNPVFGGSIIDTSNVNDRYYEQVIDEGMWDDINMSRTDIEGLSTEEVSGRLSAWGSTTISIKPERRDNPSWYSASYGHEHATRTVLVVTHDRNKDIGPHFEIVYGDMSMVLNSDTFMNHILRLDSSS